MSNAAGTFVDDQGRTWSLSLTTPKIIEVCRRTNLKLSELFDKSVHVSLVFEAVWVFCSDQAGERKMSETDFFETVLVPGRYLDVFRAFWEAVERAFPQAAEMVKERAAASNPLSGKGGSTSKTS